MYPHCAKEDTKSTVNKIIADTAKGILVVMGIGVSPCLLEDLKPTLDSIISTRCNLDMGSSRSSTPRVYSIPARGEAWSTKDFLVDGSQCQPTGDEAFIRRVEAVPLRIMFEDTSQPVESVDALSYSGIHRVVAYMRIRMHDEVAARKERARAKSPHWWDRRELVTGKFQKDEFVARVMHHLADQYDGPIGSQPTTLGLPTVLDKVGEIQPVSRNFRRLSAGTMAHVNEHGISEEEMLDVDT